MSSYSSQTIHNKSWLKRFSHLRRFRLAVKLLELKDNDRVLDYGTGDGYFITQLIATGKEIFVAGYEPSYSMYNEIALKPTANLRITNDLRDISSIKFNKIICLEVLEHLNNTNQQAAITNMKTFLDEEGIIIISVPIEIGPSSFVKNIIRIINREPHQRLNMYSFLLSFIGRPPLRDEKDDYILSHIGFDYRKLMKIILQENLKIRSIKFSPISLFRGFINSQIFFICAHSH